MATDRQHQCRRCRTYPHDKLYVDRERIRAARLRNGWTQTTLAQKLGITPQYMCQIEGGHRPTISPETFQNLLRELGVRCPRDLLLPATQVRSSPSRPKSASPKFATPTDLVSAA